MVISIKLEQCWDTANELLEYLRLLSRTMERICEMEADAPTDWFFNIEKKDGDYTIQLTHL